LTQPLNVTKLRPRSHAASFAFNTFSFPQKLAESSLFAGDSDDDEEDGLFGNKPTFKSGTKPAPTSLFDDDDSDGAAASEKPAPAQQNKADKVKGRESAAVEKKSASLFDADDSDDPTANVKQQTSSDKTEPDRLLKGDNAEDVSGEEPEGTRTELGEPPFVAVRDYCLGILGYTGGGTFFKWGAGRKCTSKKVWEIFFIRRFTTDPMLIVLLEPL